MKNNNNAGMANNASLADYCQDLIREGMALASQQYAPHVMKEKEAERAKALLCQMVVRVLNGYQPGQNTERDEKLRGLSVYVIRDAFSLQMFTKQVKFAYEKSIEASLSLLLRQHWDAQYPPALLPSLRGFFSKKQFFAWIEAGNVEEVQKLIHRHPRLLSEDNNQGEKALYVALKAGQGAMARLLVEHGAPYAEIDACGISTLHRLLEEGKEDKNIDVIRFLLDLGIDARIRKGNEGETPLHFAKSTVHATATFALMLERGAQVEELADKYYTGVERLIQSFGAIGSYPKTWGQVFLNVFHLHLAGKTEWQHVKSLFRLILQVPHLREELTKALDRTTTKFDLPVLEGAMHLIEHQEEPPSYVERRNFFQALYAGDLATLTHILAKYPSLAIASDAEGCATHIAASKGYTKLMNLLLETGAYINQLDGNGATALHIATKKADSAMIQTLIAHGVDVNKATPQNARCEADCIPLHLAVTQGALEAAIMLIKHGADVNRRAKDYGSPLALAFKASTSTEALIALLVNNGADIHHTGRDGESALYLALQKGVSKAVVALLLEKGANVNHTGPKGESALYLALQRNSYRSEKIVALLLKKGADIDHTGPHGESALYIALRCTFPSISVIRLLLEHGVDMEHTGPHGESALDVAGERYEGLPHLLTEYQADSYKTVLEKAVENGRIPVLERYLAKGLIASDRKNALLHLAAEKDRTGVVLWLLGAGATRISQNEQDEIAAEIAIRRGSIRTIRVLLNHMGEEFDNFSLFHWLKCAIRHNQRALVHLLLAYDVGSKGKEKQQLGTMQRRALLDLAAETKNPLIVKAFLERGYGTYESLKNPFPEIDAFALPFPDVKPELLESYKFQNPHKAITEWKTLFAYLQNPPAHLTWRQWQRLLDFFHSALENPNTNCHIQRELGSDLTPVTATINDLLAMAAAINQTMEARKTLHGANKKQGTLGVVPHYLIDRILMLVPDVVNARSFGEKLLAYLDSTPAPQRSLEHFIPMARQWWQIAKRPMRGAPLPPEAFFAWVREGNVGEVEIALDQEPTLLSACDARGNTPLDVAVKSGNLPVVQLFAAKAGTDHLIAILHQREKVHADIADTLFHTLLELAVAEGKLALLKSYASYFTQDMKNHLLLCAAEKGRTGILQWLLEVGAEIDTRNAEDETVFQIASRKGHARILKFLYHQHHEVQEKWEDLMTIAIQYNHLHVVKLLYGYGVAEGKKWDLLLKADNASHEKIVRFFLEQGAATGVKEEKTYKTFWQIDTSFLPLLNVSYSVLAQFKRYGEKAIEDGDALFAYVKSPPRGTSLARWSGWIEAFPSEEKILSRMMKTAPQHVVDVISKARKIARILHTVMEQEEALAQVGKNKGPLDLLPKELLAHMVTFAHDENVSPYFMQQLVLYFCHTPKNMRSLSTLIPKAFAWLERKEPQQESEKALPEKEEEKTAIYISKLSSLTADLSVYSSMVLNEPVSEKMELFKKWKKIAKEAHEKMHNAYTSDEEKIATWEAVWDKGDSDGACRKRFGVPYNPYKPRFSDVDSQAALESNIRFQKGVTKKEDQEGKGMW